MPPKSRSKRQKKVVPSGNAYIQSTFNNTIITLTDRQGNVLSWASGGGSGFKGSRKSTAFAGQKAAETAAKTSMDMGLRQAKDTIDAIGRGDTVDLSVGYKE